MDTKASILNAAEQLFAEKGFDATSLRQVTAAARVNIAAVHYHFGSKEELVRAVLTRRFEPLNRLRLELLDKHEAESASGPLSLETVLEALVGPPLRLSRDAKRGGDAFMRLAGRVMSEPGEAMQKMIAGQFEEVARRFMAAIQRALPESPMEELFWRTHFGVGAMVHTMMFGRQLQLLSGGICDPRDTELVIHRLVAFTAAGMRSRPPAPRTTEGVKEGA